MLSLAASPQEHVLDKNVLGGPDALIMPTDGMPIITMHMVTLVVAAALMLWIMFKVAKAVETGPASEGNERYITKGRLAQLVEMIISFLRDQMIEPVMGKANTDRYLPFLLTVFFFILMNNLIGLVPLMDLQHLIGHFVTGSHKPFIGGTATGNLAVTGALAFVAFLVIQVHAFRELGVKGWCHHLLGGAPWYLFWIMIPVELAGHLIKPAALAIRLFANMVAGHTLLATLMFFGYTAAKAGTGALGIGGISFASGTFALAISFLELFVAVLQAFIFMFLTAVFITLMSHHDDEHHEAHDHGAEPAHA